MKRLNKTVLYLGFVMSLVLVLLAPATKAHAWYCEVSAACFGGEFGGYCTTYDSGSGCGCNIGGIYDDGSVCWE